MADITKIAAACANRIFDRMELSRGSAILKSDIEREVEMALDEAASLEYSGPNLPLITPRQAARRGIPMGSAGYIWVDEETAQTAVIGNMTATEVRERLKDRGVS